MDHRLQVLGAAGRRRALPPARQGHLVDLASNDYLGLSRHPALANAAREALDRGVPAGAGASRLIPGAHAEHILLEQEAARFFGAEKALYFGSGYAAGLALAATLPDRKDAIVYDALAHACTRDGIRLSAARAYKARHNDARDVEDAVKRARAAGARDVWVFVESVYSMDGDAAPLADLVDIAARHGAWLVVDEAHATGVLGPGGRGLAPAAEGVVALHTCGKALGVAGALVTGPAAVVDLLVSAARPFVYATAPPPLQAAVTRRALALVDEEPWRRARVAEAVRALGAASHIVPVILGSEARALAASASLEAQGFAAPAIRPPTVPPGTARLRLSLHAGLSDGDIPRLAAAIARL
ncbi:MAG: 8-amino-7-oxononanoate synthase [Alphaproteobacteria bacterium]|nr:8-amino-7-oxononanoate synthase [Alphaproteobacteria bacterium]